MNIWDFIYSGIVPSAEAAPVPVPTSKPLVTPEALKLVQQNLAKGKKPALKLENSQQSTQTTGKSDTQTQGTKKLEGLDRISKSVPTVAEISGNYLEDLYAKDASGNVIYTADGKPVLNRSLVKSSEAFQKGYLPELDVTRTREAELDKELLDRERLAMVGAPEQAWAKGLQGITNILKEARGQKTDPVDWSTLPNPITLAKTFSGLDSKMESNRLKELALKARLPESLSKYADELRRKYLDEETAGKKTENTFKFQFGDMSKATVATPTELKGKGEGVDMKAAQKLGLTQAPAASIKSSLDELNTLYKNEGGLDAIIKGKVELDGISSGAKYGIAQPFLSQRGVATRTAIQKLSDNLVKLKSGLTSSASERESYQRQFGINQLFPNSASSSTGIKQLIDETVASLKANEAAFDDPVVQEYRKRPNSINPDSFYPVESTSVKKTIPRSMAEKLVKEGKATMEQLQNKFNIGN